MENDMFSVPFPECLSDVHRILAWRKNRYSNRQNRFTDTNDGVSLVTILKEKKRSKYKEVNR